MSELNKFPEQTSFINGNEIIFATPEISKLPSGEILRNLLVGIDKNTLIEQREAFCFASKVLYVDAMNGLGDNFLNIRRANAIALACPDKQIYLNVFDPIRNISSLKLNGNLHLIRYQNIRNLRDVANTFYLSRALEVGTQVELQQYGEYILEKNNLSDIFSDANVLLLRTHALLGLTPGTNYINALKRCIASIQQERSILINMQDLEIGIATHLLNVPLSEDGLDYPMFDRKRGDQTNEILIAPDSLEGYLDRDPYKSVKIDVWYDVIDNLPKDREYSVLIGTAHPIYCRKVAEYAHKIGLPMKIKQYSTLSTLVDGIAEYTGTFVGSDSGTTQLASMLARTFMNHSNPLKIRCLFNGLITPIQSWGVSGLGELGKNLYYEYDLTHTAFPLSGAQIADFIIK